MTDLHNEIKKPIPSAFESKLRFEIFPKTRDLLIEKISSLPIDQALKSRMVSKISKAVLQGFDCNSSDRKNGLASAFKPDAVYTSSENSFTFCRSYFDYSTSEFDLVQTISHELAHAIDPCSLGSYDSTELASKAKSDQAIDDLYLKKNFIKCLRSPSSVQAASYIKYPAESYDGKVKLYNDTIRLCDNDQINEAVADWFADDVLGDYANKYLSKVPSDKRILGFENVFRGGCAFMKDNVLQPKHPPLTNRINNELLVQPKIRAYLGCSGQVAGKKYCDINDPSSLAGTSNAPIPKRGKTNGSVQ